MEPSGDPVLLIPAYKPCESLARQVEDAMAWGAFRTAVVVDDGSGPDYAGIFAALRDSPRVTVLQHAVNLGKGAALKTGMNYAACRFPDSAGVVTADADGQHLNPDIVAVAKALSAAPRCLVLGARRFDGAVPFRSRAGNAISRGVMRAVTGQKLGDTQTGLRGIPMDFVPDLLRTRPVGYDFELDMLVQCKLSGRRILEVPIETVYIDRNRGSHFDPLWDSMRVYFVFLRFAATSIVTSLLDNLVFVLLLRMTLSPPPPIAACMIGARTVACVFNYFASKRGVFHSKAHNAVALPKFLLSAVLAGTLSYSVIRGVMVWTHIPVVAAKIGTESALFLFSFVLQRDFVFSRKRD